MSLSAMIQKRQPGNFATGTVATLATPKGEKMQAVANVATVAVASSEAVKSGNGKPYFLIGS